MRCFKGQSVEGDCLEEVGVAGLEGGLEEGDSGHKGGGMCSVRCV